MPTVLELKRWLNGVPADDNQRITLEGQTLTVFANSPTEVILGTYVFPDPLPPPPPPDADPEVSSASSTKSKDTKK
jgi:hypothetical protein